MLDPRLCYHLYQNFVIWALEMPTKLLWKGRSTKPTSARPKASTYFYSIVVVQWAEKESKWPNKPWLCSSKVCLRTVTSTWLVLAHLFRASSSKAYTTTIKTLRKPYKKYQKWVLTSAVPKSTTLLNTVWIWRSIRAILVTYFCWRMGMSSMLNVSLN